MKHTLNKIETESISEHVEDYHSLQCASHHKGDSDEACNERSAYGMRFKPADSCKEKVPKTIGKHTDKYSEPRSVWERIRFITPNEDHRPVVWGERPFWCSGKCASGYIMIGFIRDTDTLQRYYPEVAEYEICERGLNEPYFTDRFPKPLKWESYKLD